MNGGCKWEIRVEGKGTRVILIMDRFGTVLLLKTDIERVVVSSD